MKWQEKATDPGCFTSDGPFTFSIWMIDNILIPSWCYLIATRHFFFWKCCGFLCGIQKCPSIYLEETSALWVVASIVSMYCGLSEYLSVVFETFFSFSLLPQLLLISEWPADPVHHSAAWPEPQWDPAGKSCCCTCPRSLHPLLLPSSGQNLFIFFLFWTILEWNW